MKHHRAGSLTLVAVVLAACQVGPADTPVVPTGLPTDTAEAVLPTETARPTETTAPHVTETPTATTTATATSTATAAPTETPVVPATPDPNEGAGEPVYDESFDGTLGWGWGFTDDAVAFTSGDGAVTAKTSLGDAGWRVTIGPGASWLDQQVTLKTDTLACTESDEFGVLFRGALDDETGFLNGYVFKITCGGRAAVEVLRDNQPSVLVEPVEAQVNPTGENILTVWAGRSQLRFYVNGVYLATAEDSTFTTGRLGLYVRDRNGGGMEVKFTQLIVRQVTPP